MKLTSSIEDTVTEMFESNFYRLVPGEGPGLRFTSTQAFRQDVVVYVTLDMVSAVVAAGFLSREHRLGDVVLVVTTAEVEEGAARTAAASGGRVLTLPELEEEFDRVGPYLTWVLSDHTPTSEMLGDGSVVKATLRELERVYVEPDFSDQHGEHPATEAMTRWLNAETSRVPWVMITGTYGTGKTALTRILLRRWMRRFKANRTLRLPIRIELGDFTKQFTARGLLHHFLDENGLASLPVDHLVYLMSKGRVVMLLDGYDEMTQSMSPNDRRGCLKALSELAAGGACGVLTSRPNYFTEDEELRVLEQLYDGHGALEGPEMRRERLKAAEQEAGTDAIFRAVSLDRYERRLRDLDGVQTKRLVEGILHDDPIGASVVLELLDRLLPDAKGDERALSGKPIIISYLIDVVNQLKSGSALESTSVQITEWQIYDLIVRNLMARDFSQAEFQLGVDDRRRFLRALAIDLSGRERRVANEKQFKSLVEAHFATQIARAPQVDRADLASKYLFTLRRSSTLADNSERPERSSEIAFSHNSLREFLLSEHCVDAIEQESSRPVEYEVNEAMRGLTSSLDDGRLERLFDVVARLHRSGFPGQVVGRYVDLLWDAGLRLHAANPVPSGAFFKRLFGEPAAVQDIELGRVHIDGSEGHLRSMKADGAYLIDMTFHGDLTGASFRGGTLDSVRFEGCDLTNADFRGSTLQAVDFTGATCLGTRFDHDSILIDIAWGEDVFSRDIARSRLAFEGADVGSVDPIHIVVHDQRYRMVKQIAQRLMEGGGSQVLGLTRKGPARSMPSDADKALSTMQKAGWVSPTQNGVVKTLAEGRDPLRKFLDRVSLAPPLQDYFGV